jgi:L-aminopeptidase/D-esterase-like protein
MAGISVAKGSMHHSGVGAVWNVLDKLSAFKSCRPMTDGPKPGALNLITDVPGLKVGQAEDERVRTGVTVIAPDARAVAAVDVRGGGPGTRETDLLNVDVLVEAVDVICLSGGSVYGLGAADGVAAAPRP